MDLNTRHDKDLDEYFRIEHIEGYEYRYPKKNTWVR